MLTSFLLPRGPRSPRESGPRIPKAAPVPAQAARVTVRLAEAADGPALERIAGLDSARVPQGALVVAEVAGSIQAALPLDGGRAIANPFVPTADLLKLLEIRAAQLREAGLPDEEGARIVPLTRRVRIADGAA